MNPAENYILSQSEPFRSVCIMLQAIIKQTLPQVDEQFKWRLPFYKLHGSMLCFINVRKGFVDLGFVYGTQLTKYQQYLVAGEKRKQLRSMRFQTLEDIDPLVVEEILLHAAELSKNAKKG